MFVVPISINSSIILNSQIVKEAARKVGFDACGIAEAYPLGEDELQLREWLAAGYHADMHYMAEHVEMRYDPRLLLPGARSVVSVLLGYKPSQRVEGKAMIAQSLISAFSVGIVLFFAYLPHTFNIPDDSPASVFLATIRMIRIIALMSAVLSLGITRCALFGYEPRVLLAVYVAVIVIATVWYLLKIKRKKSK